MKYSFIWSVQRRYLNLGLSLGSILFGICLSAYLETTSWAKVNSSAINNPGFFPNLVSKAIILVGIALLIRSIVNFRKKEVVAINLWGLIIFALWWIYAMIMPYLGFILSSILVLIISMVIWGVKGKKTIIICSVLVPVVLYAVLGVGLGVRFPTIWL